MLAQTIQGITLYVDQFADKIKDFAVAAANEKYALSLDSGTAASTCSLPLTYCDNNMSIHSHTLGVGAEDKNTVPLIQETPQEEHKSGRKL